MTTLSKGPTTCDVVSSTTVSFFPIAHAHAISHGKRGRKYTNGALCVFSVLSRALSEFAGGPEKREEQLTGAKRCEEKSTLAKKA